MDKKIFTFWEPCSNMPAYIRLCIDTWKKHLPEYEVVLLDYSNLGEYLPAETIDAILCRKMSLPTQADCIRAALLLHHGGIWMDADTIITGRQFMERVAGSDVVMIGNSSTVHGAFIYVARPGTPVLEHWYGQVVLRVAEYRRLSKNWLTRQLWKKAYKKARGWDYFLNSILDPLIGVRPSSELLVIDREQVGAMPELKLSTAEERRTAYEQFWFRPLSGIGVEDVVSAANGGIILLHNSWTPPEFRAMSCEEFMARDTAMASLFQAL